MQGGAVVTELAEKRFALIEKRSRQLRVRHLLRCILSFRQAIRDKLLEFRLLSWGFVVLWNQNET
jgi:hypothetical protein